MKTRNIAAFLAVSLSVFSASAAAQNYPTKPIQLVVGYPAGGNTDSIARRLVQDAKKMLGWEIVVVNKVGGGGVLGMQSVADAPPDGYTLGLATSSNMTNAPWVMDVAKDLIERTTALIWLGRPQTGIAVRSESSIRNIKDMIEEARRNPGKVSIGLQGKGSGASLVLQAISLDEKVNFALAPYAGEAPAVNDLLGGHITSVATSAFSFQRFVTAGTLRTIASVNEDRLQSEPDIPTLIEQGYPYNLPTVFYLIGPRKLPEAIAKRIVDGFSQVANTADYRESTAKNNGVMYGNPIPREGLERFLLDERAKTGALMKKVGFKN
jgi:tripartite-type tricarboxylate transporter receptor subunit TctC